MNSSEALLALVRPTKGKVRRCECYDANQVGVETRELRGTIGNYRIRIGQARSRLSFSLQGFETILFFAVGGRDRVCLMDKLIRFPRETVSPRIFVSENSPVNPLSRWLKIKRNQQALRTLDCSASEPVFVFRNGVNSYVPPQRATVSHLERLVEFADRLPRPRHRISKVSIVDGLKLDPRTLPKHLRHLVPLIEQWAVGDDVERSDKLARAKRRDMKELLRDVGPLLSPIDDYLDSFGSERLPDEALLLGRLAEAVAELQAKQV